MIKFEDYEIEFEESYIDEYYESITLYFIGPKEMVVGNYPEAESTTISVEFPINSPHSENATVMISPTKDGSDYDWSDAYFPEDEIDKLIKYAISMEETYND